MTQLPATPGREVAGIVDATGPSVDGNWLGRRVIAGLGADGGGYAEPAGALVGTLHALPQGLDADDTVAMVGTGGTAVALLDIAGATAADVAVVLSYLAALGVSVFVFEYLFGFAAVGSSVPLLGFVFLVALGVDYNIFLMGRVHEESATMGTRRGMLHGLTVTGGVITSAGVVLAATFAVLGLLPLVVLAEVGFLVAFGVLLDTLLVRSVLVPALALDVGPRIWWPSALSKRAE